MASDVQAIEVRVEGRPPLRMEGAAKDAFLGRHARLAPPAMALFQEGVEYILAPELGDRAEALIARYEELGHLQGLEIVYLWRGKGGKSGGGAVLGKCVLASGLVGYLAGGAHFVVWLAADYATAYAMTDRQLEALLYHELSHADMDPEKGTSRLKAHDAAVFFSEIEHYGLWLEDMQRLGETIQQLPLGLAADA
jgi:hypothetical protein